MSAPSARPPRLALLLLRLRVPRSLAEPILGDLEERFRELAARDRGRARRFVWRQAIAAYDPRLPVQRRAKPSCSPAAAQAPFVEAWLQDLRYGARRLARTPGFTAVAALTLALGIGASTIIFGVVHATLLRSLPYEDPESLVMVWNRTPRDTESQWHFSSAAFADVVASSQRLEEIAAVTETVIGPMTGVGTPQHVKISRTSSNFFSLLGIEPVLGRSLRSEDGLPVPDGAEPPALPVLLSHGLWQRSFNGDPEVLGTKMEIFGLLAEVIGVMPEGFEMYLPEAADIGHDIDLWWPIRADHSQGPRDTHYLRVIARLSPGSTLGEAQAEAAALADRLRQEHEYHRRLGLTFELAPLADDVVAHIRPTLVFLAGAVAFVMLIACANVANLLLVRVSRRRSELAVRAALGASRGRLTRQLLSESLLLAGAGALGGLALTGVGIALLRALRPSGMPWIETLRVDPEVVGFAVLASLLAALVYGLVPAFRSVLGSGDGTLHVRAATRSPAQSRLRNGLVVAEVALSLVLLVGAGLMIRTFSQLADVHLGFDPRNLLAVDVSMPAQLERKERLRLVETVERELAAIPSVTAAGAIFPAPLNGVYVRTCTYSPDAPPQESDERGEAYFRTVTPSYFDAARVPLVAGRALESHDDDGEPAVAVVDRRLAQRLWPGQSPLGQRLFYQIFSLDPVEARVVGVVEDVRQGGLVDERPTIYIPRYFYTSMEMSFLVRAAEDPSRLYPSIRASLSGLDVRMPVDIRPMADNIQRELLPTRFVLALMSAFSVLALVLAAVGLYGVLAYSVSQRTREIGVRIAMGATRSDVLGLVLREGAAMALAGTVLGLAAAATLTRFMEHHLYEVSPLDPVAFALTAALLIGVALVASWLPARRAAGVTPNTALRAE